MEITLGNEFTQYTIDTYGTFTADSELEYELEGLVDDDKLKADYTWEDYDWDFDHKQYVADLAQLSAGYIADLFKDDKILTSISYEENSASSPREYNFITDSYGLEITFDENLLNDYIRENEKEATEYFHSRHDSYDGFISFIHCYHWEWKVAFYLNSKFDNDEYFDYMTCNLYAGSYYTIKVKAKGIA